MTINSKKRKFLATSLTATMVAAAVAPVAGFAAETQKDFPDLQGFAWAEDAINYLVGKNVIDGNTDGTFNPSGELTRAQAAKILATALNLNIDDSAEADFADTKGHWASKYVAAITSQTTDVINGYKGKFNPEDSITRQELAKMVVNAYGLELDANADVSFTDNNDWGAEQVSILASLGVVNGKGAGKFAPNANVNRAEAAVFVHRTEVDSVRVEVPQKEAVALEVASVMAINLKEIVVEFNQAADKTTAENIEAYTLNKGVGTVSLASAKLQADGKTVILTPTAKLENQATDYKLSIAGVKEADGTKLFSATDVKFTPVDAAPPTVTAVEGLGNKAIKVTFSEPVDFLPTQVSSTFKIDDKVVSGIPTVVGRTVTIELFSTLTDGEHTLDINNNIKDFAGYQLVTTSEKFNVTADTTAPTIAEVKNVTLESATVVFSEDVKKAVAETATNYYWMEGSTKRTANTVEQIDARTYKVNFTNKLPGYTTDLYIINIVDFSGNKVAEGTKVAVNAQLDQERPNVLSAVFDKNTNKKVTLTFSKAIDSASFKASNVVIKDKDGKAVSNGYKATITGKTVVVDFTTALKAGSYTFELSGLKDNTLLQNAMEPYSMSLVVADLSKPTASTQVTGALPNYIITFDKKMDLTTEGSILNPDNYYVTYTVNGNQILGKLPSGTNLSPTSDSKGVIITFPSGVTAVHKITVQGVKSEAGNVLNGYAKEYDLTNPAQYASSLKILDAKATGAKTVIVKMNQPVGNAEKTDFLLDGTNANSAVITKAEVDASDSTIVKLTLDKALNSDVGTVNVKTKASALSGNTVGITGAKVAASEASTVKDAIAATILVDANDYIKVGASEGIKVTAAANNAYTIDVEFDEAVVSNNDAVLGENFKLYRNDGTQLNYGIDYTASVSGTTVTLSLADGTTTKIDELAGYHGTLRLEFDNTNGNIVDATGHVDFDGVTILKNKAAGFDTGSDLLAGEDVKISFDYAPATASINVIDKDNDGTYSSGDEIVVTFSEALKTGIAVTNMNKFALKRTPAGTESWDDTTVAETTGKLVYTITLDNTSMALDVKAGDTITISKTDATDAQGNVPSTDIVLTLPTLP